MSQLVHDGKKIYWGTKWVPNELVIGGDRPVVRLLIGLSISPMVGSIYNMGVWHKVVAAWVKAGVHGALEGDTVARGRYQQTGLNLEIGGCLGDPHVVAELCLVFLCILHRCMAMGRLQVAFIEAHLADLSKDNTVAAQGVLYRARTGVGWGASAWLDGEEVWASFLTWEDLAVAHFHVARQHWVTLGWCRTWGKGKGVHFAVQWTVVLAPQRPVYDPAAQHQYDESGGGTPNTTTEFAKAEVPAAAPPPPPSALAEVMAHPVEDPTASTHFRTLMTTVHS